MSGKKKLFLFIFGFLVLLGGFLFLLYSGALESLVGPLGKVYSVETFDQSTFTTIPPQSTITGKSSPNGKILVQLAPAGDRKQLKANWQGTWIYHLPKDIKQGNYIFSVVSYDPSDIILGIKSYRITVANAVDTKTGEALSKFTTQAHAASQWSTVTKDNQTQFISSVRNTTHQFTIGVNGYNRYLLLAIGVRKQGSSIPRVTHITYGNQTMTQTNGFLGAVTDGSDNRVEMWGLTGPLKTNNTVTITLSSSANIAVIASSWTGVNQSDSIRTFSSNVGVSQKASVGLQSASGDVVVDMISVVDSQITTMDSSQTNILSSTGSGLGGSSYKAGADTVTMSWNVNGGTSSRPRDVSWVIGAIALQPEPQPALVALGPEDADWVAGLQALGIYPAREVATGVTVYVSREEFEAEVCFHERCTQDPQYDQFLAGIGNNNFEYLMALGAKLREHCYTGFEAMAPYFADPDLTGTPLNIFDVSLYPSTYFLYNPYPNCLPPKDPQNPGQNEIKRTISETDLVFYINQAANDYVLDRKDPFRDMVIATDGMLSTSAFLKLYSLTRGYSPTTTTEKMEVVRDAVIAVASVPFNVAARAGTKVTTIAGRTVTNRTVLRVEHAAPNIRQTIAAISGKNWIPRETVETIVGQNLVESQQLSGYPSGFLRRYVPEVDINQLSTTLDPAYITQNPNNSWIGSLYHTMGNTFNRRWVFRRGTDPVQTKVVSTAVQQQALTVEAQVYKDAEELGTKLPVLLEDVEKVYDMGGASVVTPVRTGITTSLIPGSLITTGALGSTPSIPQRIQLLKDISKIHNVTGRLSGNIAYEESGNVIYFSDGLLFDDAAGYFFTEWNGPLVSNTSMGTITLKDEIRGIVRKFFMGETGVNRGNAFSSYEIAAGDQSKDIGKFLLKRADEGKTLDQVIDAYESSYGILSKAPIPNVKPTQQTALAIYNQVVAPAIQAGKIENASYYATDQVIDGILTLAKRLQRDYPAVNQKSYFDTFNKLTQQEGLVYFVDDAYFDTLTINIPELGGIFKGTELDGATYGDIIVLRKSLIASGRWKDALSHELIHTFHKDLDFDFVPEFNTDVQKAGKELDHIFTVMYELATEHFRIAQGGTSSVNQYAVLFPEIADTLLQKIVAQGGGLIDDLDAFALTGSSNDFKIAVLEKTGKSVEDWFRDTLQVEYTAIGYNANAAAVTGAAGSASPLLAFPASSALLFLGDESVQITSAPSQLNAGDQATIAFSATDGGQNRPGLSVNIGLVPASNTVNPKLLSEMMTLSGGTNCVNSCTVTVPDQTPNGNYNWLACSHYVKYALTCVRRAVTVGPMTPNLSVHIAMDESSWTNDCATLSVLDRSGNNRNGKSCPAGTGSTTPVAGRIGNAGSFDGVNDYVQVDNPGLPTGDFTYAVWVKLGTNTDETILMVPNGTGGYKLQLYVDPQARLVVVTNEGIRLTSTKTIPLATWTHVVVTRTGSTIKAYFNGVADTVTGTDGGALAFNCPLLIGRNADSGCNGGLAHEFNGKMDDLRIYDQALSVGDISSLYTSAPPIAVSVSVNGQSKSIDDFSANPFNIHLPGTVGTAQNFTVPVVITYSNNTTKTLNWIFQYQPNTPSPTPQPQSSSGNIFVVDTRNNRVQIFDPNGAYISQFGTTGSGNGQFINPIDVATDTQGNVYVADTGNKRVQKFNANGTYISQFGTEGSGDGQFGIGISSPFSITVDTVGNLYVSDPDNLRVQKFSSNGTFLTKFGVTTSNDPDFGFPAGIDIDKNGNVYLGASTGKIAKFDANGNFISLFTSTPGSGVPYDIKTDDNGNIYVTDSTSGLCQVQKYSSSGTFLSKFGTCGSGDGQFNVTNGIAIDGSGNFLVTDVGLQRVQKFNTQGNYLFKFGSSGSSNGQFLNPGGIAVMKTSSTTPGQSSSEKIYITDIGLAIVEVFDQNGNYISYFGGYGTGNGQFGGPYAVAVSNSSGNIYVADTLNNRVQKFDSNGNYLSQFGGIGSGNGQLNRPYGITIDSSGNIYVTDSLNNRVQKFDSNGNYLSQFGSSGSGNGQLNHPNGITIDSSGNIYIVDSNNNRVQKFSSNGNYLSQFGSSGSGNGQFQGPVAVAIDSSGNIYITDISFRVQKFDSNGNYLSQFGSSGSGNGQFGDYYGPYGIAIDSSGNILVVDLNNHRVQKFDSNGNYLSQFGNQGEGFGKLDSPYGIAISKNSSLPSPTTVPTPTPTTKPCKGKNCTATTPTPTPTTSVSTYRYLYVVDNGDFSYSGIPNRIDKFTLDGTFVSKITNSGVGNGKFYYPGDVAADSSGNIYVVDHGEAPSNPAHGRVLKYSASGQYLSQLSGFESGTDPYEVPSGVTVDKNGFIYVSGGGITTAWIKKYDASGTLVKQIGSYGTGDGQLWGPTGVAIDQNGNIFVGDRQNKRVVKFDANGTYITKFGSFGTNPGQFSNGPQDVAVDSSGNVFVTDTGNHKVSKFGNTGTFISWFGTYGANPGQFIDAAGIALDSNNNIWISDYFNDRIQVYSPSYVFIKQFGAHGANDGQFDTPWGIALSP